MRACDTGVNRTLGMPSLAVDDAKWPLVEVE
jgi:hypothetical protein